MTRHLVRFGLYLVIGYSLFGVALTAQTPSKEYIRVNGRVVAIESPLPAVCQGVNSTLPLRNTGIDASGNVITVNGIIDPHWKLISNPADYGGPSLDQARMTTMGAFTSVAAFIRQVGVFDALPGYYVYRQRLDLSCHDPASAILAGTVSADDFVTIFVNGKAVTGELNSLNQDVPFNIQSSPHLVKGWNDIDFVVRNGGTTPNPTGIRITFSTRTATPTPGNQGQRMELTSTSGNRTGGASIGVTSDRAVNWSVDGSHNGTWTPASGNSTTYTATSPLANFMVVSLKATSQSNPATIAFKPLYFNPGGSGGSGTVTITGGTTNLPPFTSRAFSATVTGVPSGQPTTVRWSVVSVPANSSTNGLIDSGANCVNSMNYRAPSTIRTAGNIVLRAESCHNTSWSSTVNVPVAIASSVTVSLTPTPTTILNTATQQFTATVANADNTAVTWSPATSAAGTLTQSGLFTPTPGYTGSASVRATSNENTNIFFNHPFNVGSAVSISLSSSAPSQSILNNGTANFPITYNSTGTTGQVTFSILNLPANANFNINPPSVTNQGTASITASVSPGSAAPGTYNLTFRATNGTLTQNLPLTLSIVDCGTITVSPSNVNVFPFQMANFTATRGGAAANFGVTWVKNTPAGSFSSQLDPPVVANPQISYYAADPSTQPQTVVVTARTNNPNTACSTFGGSATVTKQTYVPNGLSLLYTNPLTTVVPLNFSRFFDYGAASQNGAGTVRFIQLELRNNLGEVYDPASACAVNFNTTTNNNDPGAPTLYAWANVSSSAAGGSSTNTNIAPRGGFASSFVTSTTSCELDGTGSDYVRSGNIFALHMKVKMKSTVFTPGTIHVYVRSYGMDLYEPAIRQYMGSFTATN
jgi:hypothetical protein